MAAAAAGSTGTVAVAGATGLVGTALVKQLLASGYAVRVLTRNVVAARGKLPYPGIQFVAPQQWSEAVRGCTAVVNLAGRCMATKPVSTGPQWVPAQPLATLAHALLCTVAGSRAPQD